MIDRILSKAVPPVFLMALLSAGTAHAQSRTIISNYPAASDTTGTSIATGNKGSSKAAGFTISQGTSYKIDSVTFRLRVLNTTSQLTINLYGDVGGNPGGAILDSFAVPAFQSTGVNNYTFAASSRYTLSGGSTYWIAATGVGPSGASGVSWIVDSPSTTPTGLATNAGYRFSTDGTYPPTNSSTLFNVYSVQATPFTGAAPEPGSWALMMLGFGIAGYALRTRKRSISFGAQLARTI